MTADPTLNNDPAAETNATAFPWTVSHAPSLDVDATERLITALPEETFQLIVREAYLFRAGQVLLKAMEDATARRAEVASTRPPFLVLRRAETKDAFNANLESATQDQSLYQRAARRNADAMKRLRKCAEVHLEVCLRETDPTYYAGLVSESLVADWHRCLARLESNLAEFIASLGAARNSLVGAQADGTGIRFVSEISRKSISRAAVLGATLTSEVAATTAVADERDRQIQGTAFETKFPRLPSFDFGNSLDEAAALPVSLLQQQFSAILERCDELRKTGLPALLQQVKQAESQHTAVKESYVLGVWQALRDFALAHYVEDHDLNEVARATEEMFDDGQLA